MRIKNIALGFVVAAVLAMCVRLPANKQYQTALDLREPIYFVVDQSFATAGCETSDKTASLCLFERIAIFKAGLNDWFKHFDEAYRPQIIITFSTKFLPVNATNMPIHLQIEEGACTSNGTRHGACYSMEYGVNKIIFDLPGEITVPTSAHEFGHALGLIHKPSDSIMSYRPKNIVQPIDIMTLCALHQECPPHDTVWCEGSFYNKCLCPSESFESSDTENRVCE